MPAAQRDGSRLIEGRRRILCHVIAQADIGFLDGVLKADEFLPQTCLFLP